MNTTKDIHNSAFLNKTDNYANKGINEYEGYDISKLESLTKLNAKHREILRDTLEEF